VTLALLTYSYSIGRLLGPLLALGLSLFVTRERWFAILMTWIAYALLCIPLLLFHRQNPEALTARFKALTYLSNDNSASANAKEFARHYLANVNPMSWLFTGEHNIRDHVEGTGSLLGASVLLAVLGAVIILRRYRGDPWWRFVFYGLLVSPVPASLTSNPFPQLRLIAFPVFFLLLTLPAIEWLAKAPLSPAKNVALGAAIILMAAQGWFFQRLYHQKAPALWYVFDGRFERRILQPALSFGRRPVYLLDEPGKAGYIQALWYGAVKHLDPTAFIRLPWGQSVPQGALLLSTEETCPDCRIVARALNYLVYLTPPYPPEGTVQRGPLKNFAMNVVCENPPSALHAGQNRELSFLIKNVSASEWPCVADVSGDRAVVFQGCWMREDGTAVAGPDVEK
jgi:hypothetical protein